MATLEELIVKIEADNKELKAALEESAKVTARSSKQMEDAINKFAESSAKEVSRFDQIMNVFAGTTLANIAVKGAEMAAEAFGFLKDKFVEGVNESMNYEQQVVRLANSLAANGKFTQQAISDLEKYIGAMEDLSGIDDQVIASNLAVLSSMTKLSSEGLQRAQSAALNLSAALGIDLDTATKMVGKASEGSTDAFKKYGLVIEETADKNLTFSNTLNTIEKRFGQAASGNMQTFKGALTGLENSFGNLFQALGDVIVKNPAIIAGMKELSSIIIGLKGDAEATGPAMAKSIGEAITQIIAVSATIYETFNKIFDFLINGSALVATTISDTFGALKSALSFEGDEAVKNSFRETNQVWDQFKQSLSESSPVTDAMGRIAGAVQQATNTMGTEFPKTKAAIDNSTESVKQLTWAQKEQLQAAQDFATQMAQQALNVQNSYQLQQDALQTSLDNQLISFQTFKDAKLQSQLEQFATEQQLLVQALEAKKITEEQYGLASLNLQQTQNNARLKMIADLKKQEDAQNAIRLGGYATFFQGLATLTESSNQRLADIGRAAAVSKATIDAYLAIQNALANVPYPANIAAAAGIGIQAFANVAKISGTKLANGIDSVPGVGAKDNFPAMLMPGERVVPTETNKDLTEFLARQGSQPQQQNTFNLIFNGPVWSDKATAGSDIIDAINEAAARGMGLRLLNT